MIGDADEAPTDTLLFAMTAANGEGNGRGRPRNPSPDQAIFNAAAELIAERGHDGFSMAAVAERAGVAKAIVYRRWPTRSHLILDTLTAFMRVAILDSGDLRADLVSFACTLAAGMRAPAARKLVAELTLASAQRPELAEAFSRLYTQRRATALATLHRAQAAGELRAGVDADMLIDQLSGALHYRMLLRGEGPSDAYAERLVDAILEGALPPSSDV
jgi:AcrR family transcriptional regulator